MATRQTVSVSIRKDISDKNLNKVISENIKKVEEEMGLKSVSSRIELDMTLIHEPRRKSPVKERVVYVSILFNN